RAEKLDARADVFALGAVLYEMATGHPAFSGATPALIFDQVLNREPRRPSERNPTVPAALEAVIARALAKEARDRYPSIAALRKDLERLQRNDTTLLGLGGRWRLPRARLRAAAAVVLALAAATLWHRGRPEPLEIESVAVLPFASPAGDAGGMALAAGLTESLVNSLSRLPGVRGAPRPASARYRGGGDLARVARGPDVRAVGTGRGA